MLLQTGAQVADQAVQGILSRIDALAAKLGTTAANVWNIYIAQAKVEAVRDSVIGGILVLLSLLLFGTSFSVEDDDIKAGAFLVGLVVLGFSLMWWYSAIGEWINPSYWAFQHLTQDLKNLL